jgi:hypothetical protein
VATLAFVTGVAVLPASAAQEGFDELSGGQYEGWAVAAGPAMVDSTDISVSGAFTLEIPFAVPLDGSPTTGNWSLRGSSYWTISFGNLGTATSDQQHTASGRVTGDRTTLELGATSITSTGVTKAPLIDDIPVNNTDSIGPMELEFVGIQCDYAWGEWILSWKSEIDSGGFVDVGFEGDWGAHRLPAPDDPNSEAFQSILPQLASFQNELVAAMSSPSQLEGVPILPFDQIWGLIEQAVALVNELNNLSACDQALLGPDRVTSYINRLTGLIQVLVRVLLTNIELQEDLELTAEAALELTTMVASVGGIGEGAVRGEIADAVEGAIADGRDGIIDTAAAGVGAAYDFVFGGGE